MAFAPEEWTDTGVRERLKWIQENKGFDEYQKLFEQYLHWDMQHYKYVEGEETIEDLDGDLIDSDLAPEKMEAIAACIYATAKRYAE